MRKLSRIALITLSLTSGAAMVLGVPVLGQDRPESILPPGFGLPGSGEPSPAPPPRRSEPKSSPMSAGDGKSASSASSGVALSADTANGAVPGQATDDAEMAATSIAELVDLPPRLAARPIGSVFWARATAIWGASPFKA